MENCWAIMNLQDIRAEIQEFKQTEFFGPVDVSRIDEASRELGVPSSHGAVLD